MPSTQTAGSSWCIYNSNRKTVSCLSTVSVLLKRNTRNRSSWAKALTTPSVLAEASIRCSLVSKEKGTPFTVRGAGLVARRLALGLFRRKQRQAADAELCRQLQPFLEDHSIDKAIHTAACFGSGLHLWHLVAPAVEGQAQIQGKRQTHMPQVTTQQVQPQGLQAHPCL